MFFYYFSIFAESINTAHGKYTYGVLFTPDIKYLLSWGADQKIKIWSLTDYKFKKTINTGNKKIDGVAISPDGKLLAYAIKKTLTLTEFDTSKKIGSISLDFSFQAKIAFSPDSKYILANGTFQNGMVIIDTATLQVIANWSLPCTISCFSINPQLNLLAVAGHKGNKNNRTGVICVYEFPSCKLLCRNIFIRYPPQWHAHSFGNMDRQFRSGS